ncbi:MAG TPA: hypothetical protein ENO11_01025, partial [Desulfobacteraceae bacterium]|nr:hypothetical protein [Desulfobacteraceae bacterium]
GALRGGRALLQGLLRCGHYGRRMYVNYGGTNGRRTLQYRCARYRLLESECQLAGGKRIEATVVEAFLLVAQAAGPEAAALVVSAIIIGPLPELYFGPPYLVDTQHHPVSFLDFCLLPFFASSRFGRRPLKNGLIRGPLLNDLGTVHSLTPPIFQ